ncbi:MAG: caspase family protein [Hyphomicrobiaceae bacterium]
MARLGLLFVTILAVLWPSMAGAERRLALVIGNDTYENLPHLARARADADAVAGALTAIGFEVILEKDATRRGFNRRLADLEARIKAGDTVFFFYAGHGVALGSDNVLLPVDLPKPQVGEESLVREEGIAVDSIIGRLQSRGALAAFLVLDACRDNPFTATGTRSIGQSRGLTRIEAPKGVFVLYSAGLGQTALDSLPSNDTSPNSVFTRNLVPLLAEPGLTHVDLAKRVQASVDKLAASIGHQQQPAYYDQIVGEFVLNTAPAKPDASAALSEAAVAWTKIEGSEDVAALRAFVDKYGKSPFGELARQRLAKLEVPVAVTEPAVPATEIATAVPEVTAPAPDPDPALTARDLQQALSDKGCYAGTVDGSWGRRSMEAVTAFNEAAKVELDVAKPSRDAVDAVVSATVRCPPATVVAPAAKPKVTTSPPAKKAKAASAATRPAKSAAKPKSKPATKKKSTGGNCFTFNGQTVCD